MTRVDKRFAGLKRERRAGLVTFITAGDPDYDTSLAILKGLPSAGADIIELGVPFSDPMADGPTIQASSQRALEKGVRLHDVIELAREIRRKRDTGLVLFSYLNPLLSYGIADLARDLSRAGVDGILITDVVGADAAEISEIMERNNIDLISLA